MVPHALSFHDPFLSWRLLSFASVAIAFAFCFQQKAFLDHTFFALWVSSPFLGDRVLSHDTNSLMGRLTVCRRARR